METAHKNNQAKRRGSLRVRAVLLFIQTALPFGLYFAMVHDNNTAAAAIAVLIALSMGLLVWLG